MKILLLSLATLLSFSLAAIAQRETATYSIKAIDGRPENIYLTEGEEGSETLIIRCGNSKLVVNDYWYPEQVHIIKNCFLEIKYAQRGGSCVGIGHTLLISVNKEKLIIPFTVMSRLTGCGAEEDDSYSIKSDIIENKINRYQMDIYIHDRKTFTNSKLGSSYNKHWIRHLTYDFKYNIFCNGYETLSGKFIISGGSPFKQKNQLIDGEFPITNFMDSDSKPYTCFYINGTWYEQGQKNYLIQTLQSF